MYTSDVYMLSDGTIVVHYNRKTPSDACQTGFSRDSNRTHILQSFAIPIKSFNFANQIVAIVSSHLIATGLYLVAVFRYKNDAFVPGFKDLKW